MAVYRCNTCQGTYNDTLPDNTLYFHTCPLQRKRRIRMGDGEEMVTSGALPVGATLLDTFYEPRPNARDENTVLEEGTKVSTIKAPGTGRTKL